MGRKGALALPSRIQRGQDVGYDTLSLKVAVVLCPLHCNEFVYCVLASTASLQEAVLLLEVCDLLPVSDAGVYCTICFETEILEKQQGDSREIIISK